MSGLMVNYGQISNGETCSCSEHHGVGQWTPKQRAAVYRRIRDVMPTVLSKMQDEFLKTWEAKHGRVYYEMEVAGVSTGEFNKDSKGQTVYGPVFKEPMGQWSGY